MKNWNLKHRILIMGLLPGLIVAVALGGYFSVQRFRDLNDLLDQRALAMAKQLAPVCEYGVMTGNVGILQNIATNMLEERDVRAVRIYNQEMEKLAHAGPKMMTDIIMGSNLHHDKLHMKHTNGSVRVRTPIYEQNLIIADQLSEQFFAEADTTGRLLGFAELELSTSNTRLERYQDMVSSFAIVFTALFFCFILSLRISQRFTGPIRNILSSLKSLEDGKYEARVRVDNSGELSQIAAQINSVAAQFQQVQEEIQNHNEERMTDLQDNVDELEIRNHQLSIGKNEALEASQMKSVFLANVSHELRTPLSGISGYLRILERSRLTDVQSAHVSTMQQQSEDLMRIIDDLLDLSKLNAEKLHIEHISYQLRELIEDSVTAAAPSAYKKAIALEFQIDDDVPQHLIGDGFRVKQILGNLISNAIKFTHEGSVSIQVSLITKRDQQASISLSVTDTGIGINEEQQARLFKPFSQADTSTARQFGGTGLGLIISKALAESMHGEIKVDSILGKGSSFTFHIVADLNPDPIQTLPTLKGIKLALLNAPESITNNLRQLMAEWQIELTVFDTLTQLETALNSDSLECQGVLSWSRYNNLDEQAIHILVSMLKEHNLPLLSLSDALQQQQTDRYIQLGAAECISVPVKAMLLHQCLKRLFVTHDVPQQQASVNRTLLTLPPQHSQEAPSVMVVDDNEPNLKLVAMLLEELGLTPLQATSGQEAIDAIKNHRIDLVFMDIQMPGMNGLQATQKIRQLPDKASVPIIALTAHAMADERQILLREGMNDYQTKPISIEQLAECVLRWTGYQNTTAPGFPSESGTAVIPFRQRTGDPVSVHSASEAYSPAMTDSTAYSISSIQEPDAEASVFSPSLALKHANNRPDLAIDMMNMLLATLDDDINTIRTHWEEEAMEDLMATVHKLHGATRYCGVPTLRKCLELLEVDLKRNNTATLPTQMRQLVTSVNQLQAWIAEENWQQAIHQYGTLEPE